MSKREKISKGLCKETTITMSLTNYGEGEDVNISIGDVHFTLGAEDVLEMAEVITSKRLARQMSDRARILQNKMEGLSNE